MSSGSVGLSLPELLIVLACIAVLVALGLPGAVRIQQEWTLLGAARLMETSLHWGRMHAVSSNQALAFEVDPDGRGYHWREAETAAVFLGTVRSLPGRIRIIRSPRRPLRFYTHGNAAPAGSYVLRGRAGEYRVIVSPAGRIRLEKTN